MKGLLLNELIQWKPPFQQYIISDGILIPQSKLILFGKYETWKSMLTYHIAYTVANGKNLFGFKTVATPTYILQIEVPQYQLRERVMKYAMGNQVNSDSVWLCTEHFIKLDKGFGVTELEKELIRTNPGLVIIDPLFKVMTGNMTEEYFIRQFVDRMDILIAKYKFALILVHHDRKSRLTADGDIITQGGEDMFGSYLQNWCDTSIRTTSINIDEYRSRVTLTFEKTRHAPKVLKPINILADRRDLTFKIDIGGM